LNSLILEPFWLLVWSKIVNFYLDKIFVSVDFV